MSEAELLANEALEVIAQEDDVTVREEALYALFVHLANELEVILPEFAQA
jgi:hypothetical protein